MANGQFYGVVESHSAREFTVLVGGRKRGCASIIVSRDAADTQEGLLVVHYDKDCNVTGNLMRGAGTAAMIRAALAFAFQQFPAMQHVYLRDNSHVVCGEYDMYLPPLEIGKSGKTWYQRQFGARCDDPDVQARLDAFSAHCREAQAWTEWWPRVQRFARRGPPRAELQAALRPLFERHGGRLRAMLQAMRAENSCETYVQWLEHYFQEFIGRNLQMDDFVIDRSVVGRVDATRLNASPYAEDLRRRATETTRKFDLVSSFIPRSERREQLDGGGPRSTFLRFGCAKK